MSNIIDETEKRLGSMVPQAVYDLAREAATLRAENERMREALRALLNAHDNGFHPMKINGAEWFTARAAITGESNE